MAAAALALRPRLAGQVAFILAAAYAVAVIVTIDRSVHAEPATTYAAVSPAAHAADFASGFALLVAGLVGWLDATSRRLGALTLLAAVAWFAPDWNGWNQGQSLVRSLGAATAPLFLAVVFHLVLAAPRGRVRSRSGRAVILGVYALAIVVGVGRALVSNPLLDQYCWRNCLTNAFLIHSDQGLAQTLDGVWLGSAAAVGVVLVGTGLWRMVSATGPARHTLLPVLVPGALVGGAEAAYAVALLGTPLENPNSSEFSSIFYARSLAVVLLALGVLWTVARARQTRAAIARLSAELGEAPPPGQLRETLAAGVGDPTLEVGYWLPASQRYVDADGKPIELRTGDGFAMTPIVRDGQQLALVSHDAGLLDGSELEREIGTAARLAVENERLQAEVLAQLDDLHASQARIVASGDAARQRLERDLHDGAQQRLLALSFELRLARAAAADGDPELATLLTSAGEEVQVALEELRDLAHGIYPAILVEAGLGPALETLADEAPLPVELRDVPAERYDASIESAAYLTVNEVIQDASRRQATFVSLEIARASELLVVTAHDDGIERDSELVHLGDRIGALGGALDLGPRALRAEIPCE